MRERGGGKQREGTERQKARGRDSPGVESGVGGGAELEATLLHVTQMTGQA